MKKDRDQWDQARNRDRDRSSRSKGWRGDKLIHRSNREDGGEDSSEESVNDEEDDDDDDGVAATAAVRMLPPNPTTSMSSSLQNPPHQHRKRFPLHLQNRRCRRCHLQCISLINCQCVNFKLGHPHFMSFACFCYKFEIVPSF